MALFFFFNDTATTEIYTLSLHDALPICQGGRRRHRGDVVEAEDDREDGQPGEAGDERQQEEGEAPQRVVDRQEQDRKSTRLNSSHANISYAVFCLKKNTNTGIDNIANPL